MLAWIARKGVSDIAIRTDDPVLVLHKGDWLSATEYRLNGSQVERILKKITGAENVVARVGAGTDYDKAISIDDPSAADQHGDPLQYRFRVNITADSVGAGLGFHAALRAIASEPPTLDKVKFPESLRERFAITQGSFLIAGPTGSGKSTTFAACQRHILEEDTAIKGAILTYEAPVEYQFRNIDSEHSFVSQVEIGVHLPSFAAGVRNAMRRKPSLAVIGEIRDPETIRAAAALAVSGHPVFGTVHANSATEILARLVQEFPPEHYEPVYAAQVNASRLFMSQLLVQDREGELCVLRDWLYLTNADKARLIDAGYRGHRAVLDELIKNPKNGQSMRVSIDAAYEAGRLSDETKRLLYRTYGEDDG